jgi:hypothetical protein
MVLATLEIGVISACPLWLKFAGVSVAPESGAAPTRGHYRMTLAGGWLALPLLMTVGIGVWLVSYLVDALRPVPPSPAALRWAPAIPIQYVAVDGYVSATSRLGSVLPWFGHPEGSIRRRFLR